MIKTIFFLIILLILLQAGFSTAQDSAEYEFNYFSRNNFLMTPASVFDEGLIGFANPANLTFIKSAEHRFFWSTDGTNAVSFKNWGLFSGHRHFGFGFQRQKIGDFKLMDYQLSLAHGTKSNSFGIAYSWSTGDTEMMNRNRTLTIGSISRPFPFVSLGLIGNLSLQNSWNEAIAEVGIRPLKSSRLTLFADVALQKDMKIADAPWSAGAAVQITEGINLIGRYFSSEALTVGLSINLGRSGLGAQTYFDQEQKHTGYSYHVRAGGMRPSVFPAAFQKNRKYLPMNLKGRVDYNRYSYFDTGTLRFMDIIRNLKASVNDNRVSAIAVNLSGIRVMPEHAWEIRQELQNARSAGKKVIIFLDNAWMTSYHLASVADKIVMDPQGSLALYGFVSGRTYFKGTLDKLGLGYDEWRFFEYKSAAETLSRDSFSPADREQYQEYVDDRYELVRDDVCQSRSLSDERFDELIDQTAHFRAEDALNAGLVDTLARWSDCGKIIANMTGKSLQPLAATQLMDNALPQTTWGELPKIAVVYGLGECAMDSGIRARWLERVFLSLAKNYQVKAVVFRVDSPGGDGMASDLVAQALKKCARVKPVIVSQGQVAGSGGYAISMYGDKIVAGPNTITGSIGVIGGFVYDKGVGEKAGMTSDFVKRGKHADVGFGISLPYLNVQIPARNLTSEERGIVEKVITVHYESFVERVAEGRGMTVEQVKEIAEGRFYSGTRGSEIGLVDEIGGLMDAVAMAQIEIGLDDDEFEIVEIPKSKGWFNLKSRLMPFSVSVEEDPVVKYLKMLTEHKGQPLPMLIPGTYPTWEK